MIFNFDSYGISIGFGGDNSKTFSNDVYSFESYGVFVGFSFDNFKAFDDGCFNSFEDGVISYDFNIIVIEV